MEQSQILYKKRIRLRRGRLKSYTELPEKAQKDFRRIKQKLCEKFKRDVEVYLYGSYYHGYWDDKSDYDVVVHESCDLIKLNQELLEELGFQVHVQSIERQLDILIP